MKAIGFDLDDTLYNRLTVYEQAFQEMEKLGADNGFKLAIDFDTFNQVYAAYSEEEYQAFMAGEKSETIFKNDRVIRTYAHFDKVINAEMAQKFNDFKNAYQKSLTLTDDLVALIEAAMAKGLQLFVLTNGSTQAQIDKLTNLKVDQFINPEYWFISESLNSSKPDQAVFNKVAAAIDVAPADILFVGDDYVNDIQGAINAGWQAIHYSDHEEPNFVATCTTDDFLEMRTLLANL